MFEVIPLDNYGGFQISDMRPTHDARGNTFVTVDNPAGDGWDMTTLTIRKQNSTEGLQTFDNDTLKLWVFEGTGAMWAAGDGSGDSDMFDGTGITNILVDGEAFTLDGAIADDSYIHLTLDSTVYLKENTTYMFLGKYERSDDATSPSCIEITQNGAGTPTYQLQLKPDENKTRTTGYALTYYVQGMGEQATAANPSPPDDPDYENPFVPLNTNLMWDNPVDYTATKFVLNFRSDDSNWLDTVNPTVVVDPVADLDLDGDPDTTEAAVPVSLASATAYFWRVDSHEPDGDGTIIHTGATWTFMTAGKAINPKPEDGLVHVSPVRNLSWEMDTINLSSKVYFGPVGDLRYVGQYAQSEVSLADCANALGLEMLLPDTEYQWRIDTIDLMGDPVSTGDTWTFTTEEYVWSWPIVVEDFDSYTTTSELLSQWSDGTTNGSNSTISLEPLYGIVTFSYDNSSAPYYSQTTCPFSAPQDWTDYGASQLSLKVLGMEGNDSESMYLLVGDGTTSATIDLQQVNTANSSDWQTFNMRLAELTDAGVDISHVTQLALGCGDGENPGGNGALYLNDIIRYQHRCLPEFRPAGDLDGDCLVDVSDLRELAADWLMADFTVTASAPDSGSLMARFQFEDSGTTASDSSGNDYHATIDPQGISDYWDSSGQQGNCLEISGNMTLSLPADIFDSVDDAVTIAFWISGDPGEFPHRVNSVDFAAGAAPTDTNIWGRVQWQLPDAGAYGAPWNHYAFVKDVNAGVMRIYHNGVLVSQNTEDTAMMNGSQAGQTVMALLMESDSSVRIDELHIYNTALNAEAVAYLAAGPAGEVLQPVYPILTNADIVIDGVINWADFARVASDWLHSP